MSANNLWSVLIPAKRDNLIKNPMAGGTSSYSAQGSATVSRVNSPTLFGYNAFRVQTTTTNDGIRFTLSEAMSTSKNYVLTIYQRGYSDVDDLNESPKIATAASNTTASTLHYVRGDWRFTYVTLAGATYGGASSTYIDILEGSATTNDYVIGFVQLEEYGSAKGVWSSPIAGDLEGCYWLGQEHNSASRRLQTEYSGGVEVFFNHTDSSVPNFGVNIEAITGVGSAPVLNTSHPLAFVDGEQQDNQTQSAREMTFNITTNTTDRDNWHLKRRQILRAFKSTNTKAGAKASSVVLRYYGNMAGRSGTEYQMREIRVAYDGGGEGAAVTGSNSNQVTHESLPLRLIAHNPVFYGFGEKSAVLDIFNGGSYTKYSVYLDDDGTWGDADDAGLLNSKQSDGSTDGGSTHFEMCDARNGMLLIGTAYGENDTVSQIMHAEVFLYKDGAWSEYVNTSGEAFNSGSASPAGTDFDAFGSLLFGNNNNFYVTPKFDGSVSGSTGSIFEVDIDSGTYTDLGTPDDTCRLAVGIDGYLYAFGSFSDIGGTSIDKVGRYKDGTWTELSSGLTVAGTVTAFAQGPDGTVYFSGDAASAYNYVLSWNPDTDTFSFVSNDGFDSGLANALLVDNAGTVYMFGTFTATDGNNLRRAAYYQGGNLFELGKGFNGAVTGAMWYDVDKTQILAWGDFTSSADGSVSFPHKTAIWTGSEWVKFTKFWGSAIKDLAYDPVTGNAIYVNDWNSGSGPYSPGETTVSYEGTNRAFPRFVVENNSSSTSSVIDFVGSKTTDAAVNLDYTIEPGEKIEIDFLPGRTVLESSMFGGQWSAVASSSDVGSMSIIPNGIDESLDNVIQIKVLPAANQNAYVIWRDAYDGFD